MAGAGRRGNTKPVKVVKPEKRGDCGGAAFVEKSKISPRENG